jgi:FtsP/CotA-like multicopper oxidase with cupredoxin domain
MTETPWWKGSTSPLVISVLSIVIMVALVSFSIGTGVTIGSGGSTSASSSDTSSSSSSSDTSMSSTASTPTTANVPNATQNFGNQPAHYVIDKDGVKHFTLTAEQVMWEPVKGHRVLAFTLDGTVPGPVIRATAGDHVRITLINHLSQATSMHWHGLEVPASQDGVPGVGQNPINPGKSYTYDFTLHDEDAGTHWYHSHDNDIMQVTGGFYGAFIVDPRPGSLQAKIEPKSDVEYLEMISELGPYYVINGKSFPDTQPIKLKHGQTVRLRIIGASEMMHPMHLHGGFFNIVAEDGHTLQVPIQKDTVQVAPGETYDLTFYGWAAPGSVYPFHCHILSHLMNPGQSGDQMGGLITLVEYAK